MRQIQYQGVRSHDVLTSIHHYHGGYPPRLLPDRGGTKHGGGEARVRGREGPPALTERSSCNLITSNALDGQFQLNPHAEPFIPTVGANKLLQHRYLYRGKREEEAPGIKHHTQLGWLRWATRRGVGEPNPPCETKNSGAVGVGTGGYKYITYWKPLVY